MDLGIFHELTYKVHIPDRGPHKGERRYFVDCSCGNSSPYEHWITSLDRWIVAHLTGMGQIKSDKAVTE